MYQDQIWKQTKVIEGNESRKPLMLEGEKLLG